MLFNILSNFVFGIGIGYYFLLPIGLPIELPIELASSRVLGRAGLGGWLGLKCYWLGEVGWGGGGGGRGSSGYN